MPVPQPPRSAATINRADMLAAIRRSGYLIEQRVEFPLVAHGYYVQTNPVYPDANTGKTREYDIDAISAVRVFKDTYDFVFQTLLIECQNNPQPIVFFTKKSQIPFMHHYEVKVAGIPTKFKIDNQWQTLSEFTK